MIFADLDAYQGKCEVSAEPYEGKVGKLALTVRDLTGEVTQRVVIWATHKQLRAIRETIDACLKEEGESV